MGNIKIGKMVLGMIETNCYFLYDEATKEAIVVDPAKRGVIEKLTANGINPVAVILTHGHFDHIMGVHEMQDKGCKVYVLKEEEALCKNANLNASADIRKPYIIEPDVYVTDGEEITIAGITLKVIATPGHTAGSCCYYIPSEDWLISGDTLFRGSIGRSDLPTGSEEAILKSVNMLLDCEKFNDDTKVYPGHGDTTTIGFERKYNPFRS